MAKTANNIAHFNKHWRHAALTIACVSMLVFSFCLVANASTEETATTETVTNETAVEARQSESVAQTEQMQGATDAQESTNNEVTTETLDRTSETRAAATSSNNIADVPSVTGIWKLETGGWRFYNKSGVMQKGFCYIDGKKYYFGPNDGLMKVGWQKIGRYYYYFGTDGAMKLGWQKISGRWYYFDKAGTMIYDYQTVDGKDYWFGGPDDGALKIGWIIRGEYQEHRKKVADIWSYSGADGAILKNSWLKYGGYWYHFDDRGIMETGATSIDGKGYYFGGHNDGRMKTGWQYIEDFWAYLGADGAAKTGWQKVGAYWYYLGEYGEMETGLRNIDGGLYFLGSDGAMRTGWQKDQDDWYYFNASGAALKGWQQIGGYWYYFEQDYKMVSNTIKELDGKKYAFNADGVMLSGYL